MFQKYLWKKYLVFFELHKSLLFVFFLIVLEIVVKIEEPPHPQNKNGLATDQNLTLSFNLKFSALKMSGQVRCTEKERKEKN